jgi:hypothetical protein
VIERMKTAEVAAAAAEEAVAPAAAEPLEDWPREEDAARTRETCWV